MLSLVAIILFLGICILAPMAWHKEPECPQCGHCRTAKAQRIERQKQVQHDYEHLTLGRCADKSCSRNEKRLD